MPDVAETIGVLLRQRGLTIGTVESATGGLISHLLTNVSGSSDYYKGSVVAYSNGIKINVVGVKAATIEKYGAVSAPVAEQMAAGGRKLLDVDICVADTGIAGPTGATPGKPVGLFYLGLAHAAGAHHRKHVFSGNREHNKLSAAQAALDWVLEYMENLE
jgi:PncC family amidohydrolase